MQNDNKSAKQNKLRPQKEPDHARKERQVPAIEKSTIRKALTANKDKREAHSTGRQ